VTVEAGASPLGILAAGGDLPIRIAASARAGGRAVYVVALEGIADAGVAAFPHSWSSLGQVNRILGAFRKAGCRELVIAGAMQRPDLLRLKVDLGFFRHLGTVARLTRGGDDSVLRRVVRFFEAEGFAVTGIGDVAPELLAPPGQLGAHAIGAAAAVAIEHGARLMTALGPFDVGQAIVATADGIIAVEGVTGTDAMLRELAREGGAPIASGGVLLKLAKPGQELRVDLPTIGPTTVERAAAAGLAAIAVSAGAAVIMDRPRTLAAADAAGLAVVGVGTGPQLPQASLPCESVGRSREAAPMKVHSRRAPTPAERRDVALARRLLPVLAGHRAGRAAVIAGEHVLAVPARLPLERSLAPLGARRHWGLRALRRRIGILALDLAAASGDLDVPQPSLDLALFRAVREARLAGVVCLGGALPEAVRADVIGWANDAQVFLMAEAG